MSNEYDVDPAFGGVADEIDPAFGGVSEEAAGVDPAFGGISEGSDLSFTGQIGPALKQGSVQTVRGLGLGLQAHGLNVQRTLEQPYREALVEQQLAGGIPARELVPQQDGPLEMTVDRSGAPHDTAAFNERIRGAEQGYVDRQIQGARTGESGTVLDALPSPDAALQAGGKLLSTYAEKVLKENPEWQRSPELINRPWTELLADPKTRGAYLARALGENAPNLVAGIGAGVVGGLTMGPGGAVGGASLFTSTLETGYSFDDLRKLAGDDEAAAETAQTVGVVNAFLETLPINRLLLKNPILRKSILKSVTDEAVADPLLRRMMKEGVSQAAAEGITEGLQEVMANVGKRVYDKNQDLLHGVGESVFIGSLMGGGIGVASGAMPAGQSPEVQAVSPQTTEPPDESAPAGDTTLDSIYPDPEAPQTPEMQAAAGRESVPDPARPDVPIMPQPEALAEIAIPKETGENVQHSKVGSQTSDRRLDSQRQDRGGRKRLQQPDEYADQVHREKVAKHKLTPEQAEAFAPNIKKNKLDYFADDELMPTLERAQKHRAETGQEAHIVYSDIANMGGGNEYYADKGGELAFDEQFFIPMAKTLVKNLQTVAPDADIVPIRWGGDELNHVIVNATGEQIEQAMQASLADIARMNKELGLSDIKHKSVPNSPERGVGLYYGIEGIEPGEKLGDIMKEVARKVALNKLERKGVRKEKAGIPGVDASGGQAGRTESGAVAPAEGIPGAEKAEAAGSARIERDQGLNYVSPKLKRENYRALLKSTTDKLVEGGGIALTGGDFSPANANVSRDKETQVRRTPSVNPKWFQRMAADPETSMSVADVKTAVQKALAGERLGMRQARVVETILGEISLQRTDPDQIAYIRSERDRARELRQLVAQGANPNNFSRIPPEFYDDAGQEFVETEYYAEMTGSARSLLELADQAEEAGFQDEVEAILSKDITDPEMARELFQLIEAQYEKPGEKRQAGAEEDSGKPAEQAQARPAEEAELNAQSDSVPGKEAGEVSQATELGNDKPAERSAVSGGAEGAKRSVANADEKREDGQPPTVPDKPAEVKGQESKQTPADAGVSVLDKPLTLRDLVDSGILTVTGKGQQSGLFDQPKEQSNAQAETEAKASAETPAVLNDAAPADLFGKAPVKEQAAADAQRAVDEKLGKGKEEVPVGMGDGELFSGKSKQMDIADAAAEAATSPKNDLPAPTEAQREAGNYKKGHVRINGLDISIENPAGSRRRPEWPVLKQHYGYIKGTVGKDKDHIDVFLTDDAADDLRPVFVVDQVVDGKFDEHKVMLGFKDLESARAGYLSNYQKGWKGLDAITAMSWPEFKTWLESGNTKKPVSKSGESMTFVGKHDVLIERKRTGDLPLEEYQQAFKDLVKNRDAVILELSAMTKDKLLELLPPMQQQRYKSEVKAKVIEEAYENMLSDFIVSTDGMISYSLGIGGNYREKMLNAITQKVQAVTQEKLDEYAEKVKAAREEAAKERAERVAGLQDPKTLNDFQNLLRLKMADGMTFAAARMELTPDQREQYDLLAAEESRPKREADKRARKTRVYTSGQKVTGEIIETKHTKKGHDLFVVQLGERVSKEDYNALNTSAKKMGGYYSSYRGHGAVPGFTFTERAQAEAFSKLAGGDTDQAQEIINQRRDAFEDNREQSAVERLREMADKLDERADEQLSRDRKENTSRRAAMAARAESKANYDKSLAKTMRKIADGIEAGSVKFLDDVRTKAQVEMLNSLLSSAKSDEAIAKYPGSYEKQQDHRESRPTKETVDYANWPTYSAWRMDLAKVGRQLSEIDGSKLIGQKLLKIADDVTKEYIKFAKENLDKVSTFTRAGGERAVFASKADAETAISRSGFNGQAIVLPFKPRQNIIIMSPAEAKKRGIWEGADDQRISLSPDLATEIIQKTNRANRRRDRVEVPWQLQSAHDKRTRLASMGIETPAEFRAALREYVAIKEPPKELDKVKEKERSMIGRRQDGLDFFPTPAGIADEMIETAGIEEGMTVLEPSAGMGHIADRIREADIEPDVIELSGDRRELLELKGYNIVDSDFLQHEGQYDRIIMNPPFSDRRDVAHIKHAYDLLKPGGRLVAIAGEGVFFGSDKKANEFREWMESVGATDEKLEEGVFLDPSLPVNTGVSARMVVIDKPTEPSHSKQSGLPEGPKPLGMTPASVEKVINEFRDSLNGAPQIEYTVEKTQGDAFGDQSRKLGRVKGAHNSGRIVLVAENLDGKADAVRTLRHETLAHFGLDTLPAEPRGQVITKIRDARDSGSLKRIWDAVDREYTGYSEDKKAEEVFARIAEDPASMLTKLWNDIVLIIQKALRALNIIDDTVTKAELRDLIESIAEGIRRGAQRQSGNAGTMFQLEKENQTNTKAFRDWFGDSKVVDESGNPLVVYHGTAVSFDSFKTDKELGAHFGTDEQASMMANGAGEGQGTRDGANVIPVFLKIKNPLRLRDNGGFGPADVLPQLKELGIAEDWMMPGQFSGPEGNRVIQQIIEEAGYDGVVYLNRREGSHDPFGPDGVTGDELDAMSDDEVREQFPDAAESWIVFHPSQIKSAIGNRGTFDPSDPNIMFSKTVDPVPEPEKEKVFERTVQALKDGQPIDAVFRVPFDIARAAGKATGLSPAAKEYYARAVKSTGDFYTDKMPWIHPLVDWARAGIIDRYGLDQEYIKLDERRATDKRRVLLQAERFLKDMAIKGVTDPNEAKAFHAILTGDAMPDDSWKSLSDEIRQALADMGQEAVRLGLITQEAYERNAGSYLHRVYLKHEGERSALGKFVNNLVRSRQKKLIGNELKGRGIFVNVAPGRLQRDAGMVNYSVGTRFVILDKTDGKYTDAAGSVSERVYWPEKKPVPDKYKEYTSRGVFEVRRIEDGKVTLWRDYTKEEREKMGEILDSRYAVAKTFHLLANDLASARFLDEIAKNPAWTWQGKDKPDGEIGEAKTGFMYSASTYSGYEWIQVPESKIAGTKVNRWGALAGKYVRAEIWRDLAQLDEMQKPSTWRDIMTQFKLNKTARNPVVHMNNIMSNLMLMDMADIRFADLFRGIQSLRDRDEFYQEAEEFGAFGHSFIESDIKRNTLDPILEEMMKAQNKGLGGAEAFIESLDGLPLKDKVKLMGKILDKIWYGIDVEVKGKNLKVGLKTLDATMINAYQREDEFFRMAAFLRYRAQGMDAETAARRARDQFLDYDIRAPWVNLARRTVLPFISYFYRAVPVVARSIAQRPWKMAKYFTIAYGLNALGYALSGGDEDDERKSMRDEVQGYTWVGTPRMIRMPWNDKNNDPVFLDIRRWIPVGDIFDTNMGQSALPIPAQLVPGGPIAIAFEFLLNKQNFTGKEIVIEKADDAVIATEKTLDWLWKSWMPAAPWVPNSWYWTKIDDAFDGAMDPMGREYSPGMAMLSSVGVKLQPHNVDLNMGYKFMELEQRERAVRYELKQLEKMNMRKKIDPDVYGERKKRYENQLKRLGEEAKKLSG